MKDLIGDESILKQWWDFPMFCQVHDELLYPLFVNYRLLCSKIPGIHEFSPSERTLWHCTMLKDPTWVFDRVCRFRAALRWLFLVAMATYLGMTRKLVKLLSWQSGYHFLRYEHLRAQISTGQKFIWCRVNVPSVLFILGFYILYNNSMDLQESRLTCKMC